MMANRINSLPGPDDIYREVLPNGITVLARSNFNSPSVVMAGYFEAGALFDPDEKLGLAEYTTIALMRGTKKRTFDEIYNALESVGASLGFNTGVHKSGFNGRSLSEDLPLLLNLFSEALTMPGLPEELRSRNYARNCSQGLPSVPRIPGIWLRWFSIKSCSRIIPIADLKMAILKRSKLSSAMIW